jgi:hypothetical protein
MNHDTSDRPGAGVGDYALGFALLEAVQTYEALVQDWGRLSAEEQARWAGVARTAAAALQDCPGLLEALPGETQPSVPRTELFDLLQCALAYVSNAVSLHRDISTALYAARHYRCPCGTCHFAGDAQCECRPCRAGEDAP